MKPLLAVMVLMGALVVTSCADGPADLLVRGQGPDGCRYDGPDQISEGRPVEFGASPSGSGRITAAIRQLRSEGVEGEEADLGPIVARVENEDEINLATTRADLAAGRYAITCHYGDFNGLVGTITVTP